MRAAIPLLVVIAMTVVTRAQDPLATLPDAYTRVFENSAVDVIRASYRPHEKLAVHDHSQFPTVYVYLSNSGPVRFTHVEQHPFTMVRPPLQMGMFRVSPGRMEKHEVENLGDIPSEFLRVELKNVPLRALHEFRGKPGFDLTRTTETTEYASPALSVVRIIVAGVAGAPALTAQRPTLLIAFTPAIVAPQSSPPVQLKLGDVYWIERGGSVRVRTTEGGAAHLLALAINDKESAALLQKEQREGS